MKKTDSILNEKEVYQVFQKNLLSNQRLRTTLFNFIEKVNNEMNFSETMSLYSHLPKKYYDHFDIFLSKKLSAKEALSIAIIVNHLDPLLKYEVILGIEELCYKFQYEGKWHEVNTIIQIQKDEEKFHYLLEISQISERELFGNYLKLIPKALKQIVFKDRRQQKVKRPQRKRGYNDHGSRRPLHKWLPRKIQNSENPQKFDFRGKNFRINLDTLQLEEIKPGSHQQPTQGRRSVNEK